MCPLVNMNWIIPLTIYLLNVESSHNAYPIVEVENGKLQGHLIQPVNSKAYYGFQEIPYAEPPIGKLRLLEPVPPKKWIGIRDATKNTKICNKKVVSFNVADPRENEDCLYLNVFTPKLTEFNKNLFLPVYVYIYGGMLIMGDPTEYNFQGFLDEDIVVVTMSYRSLLGFITTGDRVIPGNVAIKDQLLALKWVNKNIARFGGDPGKVTLGGHSSGAILTGFHLLNIKEKGLFRSVIIQSSSPLTPMSFMQNPKYFSFALGEKLSADFTSKNTSEDLLKLLQSVPIEMITKTDIEYPDWFDYPAGGYRPTFLPIVEDPDYENAVITGPMHENFDKGISNHVPVLIGITSEEFIQFYNATEVALMIDANVTRLLDPVLRIKPENVLPMAKEIKDIYSKDRPFTFNLLGLTKAMSDLYFAMPVIKNAYLHSKYSDVYFYQFSYKSPYNGVEEWKLDNWITPEVVDITGHTDELPLLFYYRLNSSVTPTDEDLLMRKRLIKLWTNFIKYTNPTPEKHELFQNITWPLVRQENFSYVDINSNISVKKNPKKFIDWQERIEKYFDSPRYSY